MKPTDRQRRKDPFENLGEQEAPSSASGPEQNAEPVEKGGQEQENHPEWDRPLAERAAWVPRRAAVQPNKDGGGVAPDGGMGLALEEIAEAAYERRGRLLFVTSLFASLAALVAVALSGYVFYLRSECARLETARDEAFRERDQLRDEVGKLKLAAAGLRDTGVVHGRVVLRDKQGRRRAIPGVVVRLYDRAVVEEHLAKRAAEVPATGFDGESSIVSHFAGNLPTPIVSGTTDSAGSFELVAPGPGEYVIQAGTVEKSTRALRFWLLHVNAADPLNTAVEINPENEVKVFDPLLMIREAR